MTATSILFAGKRINIPGAYTEVDASGLASAQLGSTGIVGVIGLNAGSAPQTIHRATTPSQARKLWADGDLRDVVDFLFQPAVDADVPGGAQELRMIAANPSLQSSYTFNDVAAIASMVCTSKEYGLHTTGTNMTIAAGTNKGKLLTLAQGDVLETFDDVGGDAIFSLLYTPGAQGASTMTGEVRDAGGGLRSVRALFTKAFLGENNLLDGTHTPGDVVSVKSDNVGDTTQTATIFGTDNADNPVSESLALNGTTLVTGTQVFKLITAVQLDAVLVGVLTVQDQQGVPNVSFTVPAGTLEEGLAQFANIPVENATVSIVADGATVKEMVLYGRDETGASQAERVVLNGAVPVVTTGKWSEITHSAIAQVEVARTVTISGTAVDATTALGQATIKAVLDKYNGKGGFTATDTLGQGSTFDIENLDITAAATITAAKSFYAELQLVVDFLNANSSLVTAARATGAKDGPANTVGAVFLAGGTDGTTTFTEWQAALDLLRTERVNTVLVMTSDPAVHAAAIAHCNLASTTDKSERDCKLGMPVGTTKSAAKALIVAGNNRNASFYAQEVERFDLNGQRRWYPPYFQAALAAGMQAGSVVGMPLTHKYANVLDFRNDTSWDPKLDASELIDAGLCFLEQVDGVGSRWVRGVTSWLQDTNLAYIEQSVNEAVNYSVYNLRQALDALVGQPTFAGTAAAAQSLAASLLDALVDVSISRWKNLTVVLNNDVLEINVDIAPILGINFVPATIHLTGTQQQAA